MKKNSDWDLSTFLKDDNEERLRIKLLNINK